MIKPGGVCLLLARINFGRKIRETGISFCTLEPLPDCISEPLSTFSIAHQHFMQLVPPLHWRQLEVKPGNTYVYSRELIYFWAKNTRRTSLCTLEPLPDCISEPLSTFSIAHQHFMQLVPPLEAIDQAGRHVCLLAMINFGQKIRDGHLFLHT